MKKILLNNRFQFTKYCIGAVISATMSLLVTFALKSGFEMLEATSTDEMLRIAALTFGLFIAVPIIFFVSRWLRIGFMRDVLVDVRTQAFEHIMDMDIEQYRQKPKETYLSSLVSDLNLFEKDYFLSLLNIVSSGVSFILGVVIIWAWVSPRIALATVAVSVVLFAISRAFELPVRKAQLNNQNANLEYNMELSNVLNGLEVMKLYQVEHAFKSIAQSIVETVEALKTRYHRINGAQTVLTEGIASVYQVTMLVYATYLWTVGEIAMGSMILVFNLTGQMVWGFVSLTSFINRYKAAIDVYHRLTDQKTTQGHGEAVDSFADLSISKLSYAYGDHQVFKDLAFSIEPASKVLIYGPSGIGKTTLLNCMTHCLTNYEGSIVLNQQCLRDVDYRSYLNLIGYVRQQHFMFEDSIKHNIVLNQPYDEAKLRKVLQDVDLWRWVEGLEEGWDHKLEQNGNNISGGQKQRLSIARELYRECDLLFIDEPSASLDDETSRHIYDTIVNLDRTVVCVSHRHLDYLKHRFDAVIDLGGHAL